MKNSAVAGDPRRDKQCGRDASWESGEEGGSSDATAYYLLFLSSLVCCFSARSFSSGGRRNCTREMSDTRAKGQKVCLAEKLTGKGYRARLFGLALSSHTVRHNDGRVASEIGERKIVPADVGIEIPHRVFHFPHDKRAHSIWRR